MKGLIGDSLSIFMQKFKEEFGESAKLEEDDEFVTCFANGVMIVSVSNGTMGIKMIGGKAYQSDYEVPVYKNEFAEE